MPELQLFTNNASANLAAGLGTADTVLELEAGQGIYFPAPLANQFCYLTLVDANSYIEIVKCTARAGDVLTIVRAQESTVAREFAIGDIVELRVTAGTLGRFAQMDANNTITGLWTYSNNVVVPVLPTQAAHATSKQYVDAAVLGHDHAGQTIGPVVLANGSTAVTQSPGSNNTRVATTAYVDAAVAGGGGGGSSGLTVLAAPVSWTIPTNSGNWYTHTLSGIPDEAKAALIAGTLVNNYLIEPGEELVVHFSPVSGLWTVTLKGFGEGAAGSAAPFLMPLVNRQFRTRRNGTIPPTLAWFTIGYML